MPDNSSLNSTVWYIEARETKSPSAVMALGSSVAVILSPPGERTSPRRYLLTCCHCVRGPDHTGQPRGKLLPHVLCWPCGPGYSPIRSNDDWPASSRDGSWPATIIDIYERPAEALNEDQIGPGVDWVLLDIEEAAFQERNAVDRWVNPGNNNIAIVGYPEGNRDWNVGTPVEPELVPGFRMRISPRSPARTRLSGPSETAPGMSGGGMFTPQSDLVGIHRSSRRVGNSVGGVAASHIAKELEIRGYVVHSFLPGANRRSLLGVFRDRLHSIQLYVPTIAVVACLALFVLSISLHLYYRKQYFVTDEKVDDKGNVIFSYQEIIGSRTVFKPGFESLADRKPNDWLPDFPNPETVQPIELIRAAKAKLSYSNFAAWFFGITSAVFALLKLIPLKPSTGTFDP